MQDILSMDIEKELPVLDSTGEDPVINDEEIKEIKSSGGEDGEVYKQINVVSVSDGINNNSSSQTLNLNDYEVNNIYTNSNPSGTQSAFSFNFDYNAFNSDYLLFRYKKNNTDSDDNAIELIISKNDFYKTDGSAPRYMLSLSNNSGGSTYTYRRCNYNSNTGACEVSASTGNNNQNILLSVDALKYVGSTTPDPTPTPTPDPVVSGNTINNYYTYYNTYTNVSDNSLSYNLLNKPLNEYTVSEGYLAFGTMIFLCVGIYLIIRRSIFKWR